MRDLIEEYKKSLKLANRALRRAEYPNDRALLGGMISDLRFAIEWMETGRMPGRRRGIERRAAYQRETPMDPQKMEERMFSADDEEHMTEIADEFLQGALSRLTERERDVYVMCKGRGLARSEAAEMLGLSKGAVNTMLARSKRKIERWRQTRPETVTSPERHLFYEKEIKRKRGANDGNPKDSD